MKNLVMMLMMVAFAACNGGGGGSTSAEAPPDEDFSNVCIDQNNQQVACTPANQDLVVTYNSHGVYQNTGVSVDQMGTFDEDRVITLPRYLDVIQLGSIQNNDYARLIFADSTCVYQYDGAQFELVGCNALLNGRAYGYQFTLRSVRNVGNPQMNGIIRMGVVRNPAANHTGTIEIEANLE